MAPSEPRDRLRFGMDVVVTVASVVGCGLLLWLNWDRIVPPSPNLPAELLTLEGATLKGESAAPVVLIEFSDYACPYCAKSESEVMPRFIAQYVDTGKVQLAFRHLPLESIHPDAPKAAEAALCAGQQGRFWDMHAALFQRQKELDETGLLARGRELGLDQATFVQCLTSALFANQVATDVEKAARLGLTGTPAFVVGHREEGGVRVVAMTIGAAPFSELEESLENALNPPMGLLRVGTIAVVAGVFLVVAMRIAFGRGRYGPTAVLSGPVLNRRPSA